MVDSDSDGNGTASTTTDKKTKHRNKSRQRRTKGYPFLSFVGHDQETEVAECKLETNKSSTVSFKFSYVADSPEDMANQLVSSFSLPATNANIAD